jgi:diguanylate cyclase
VDLSLFPDIFALAIFIVGFRPLARRVGAHANLWFLGWGFVLLGHLAQLFEFPPGIAQTISVWVRVWSLALCGITFLVVSANVPVVRLERPLIIAIAIPILVQASLYAAAVRKHWVYYAALALFFLPIAEVLRQKRRSRSLLLLGGAFAVYPMGMVWAAVRFTDLVACGSIALLFICAAYFYLLSAQRYTRGVIAAVTGLATWGLMTPLVWTLKYLHPGIQIHRGLVELPQFLVVAGIMLTLLEEHVIRTERMAMHDPLTDLPNRRMFEERLIATMEEARQSRTTVACLVIDVDNFKTINDTLGHTAGDQLLRALAVRLSWHMSPRDILARTGGDEFTALLAGVSDEHHLRFIAGAMMSAGSVPIMLDGQAVDVRISIGIALSPDHAEDIDGLRRAADAAMYSAKRRGGSLLAFAGEE